MRSVRLFQAKMQKRDEQKTEEQKKDDKIRETKQTIENFCSRNRNKITTEVLATLLPQLETELKAGHSLSQYNSLITFLRLCCRYKDILPESLSQFKEPKTLFDRFLSLKNSKWIRNESSLVVGFIDKQLEKNKPQLTTEKPMEESKEEAKEHQLVESFAKFKY